MKIEQIKKAKIKTANYESPKDNTTETPCLDDGENTFFAYASAKLKIRFVHPVIK